MSGCSNQARADALTDGHALLLCFASYLFFTILPPSSAMGVETTVYTWTVGRMAAPAADVDQTRWGPSTATKKGLLLSWALSTTRQIGSNSGENCEIRARSFWNVGCSLSGMASHRLPAVRVLCIFARLDVGPVATTV